MDKIDLGEKNGWRYVATKRGEDRFGVARVKKNKRVFIGTAYSRDMAQRMADNDKQDRR